jgi:hypothetical protein
MSISNKSLTNFPKSIPSEASDDKKEGFFMGIGSAIAQFFSSKP